MPHRIIWRWYTGYWWVGCNIWYSKEGAAWGHSPSRLLAIPAHPSTVSVPTAAALRFQCVLKGFNWFMLFTRWHQSKAGLFPWPPELHKTSAKLTSAYLTSVPFHYDFDQCMYCTVTASRSIFGLVTVTFDLLTSKVNCFMLEPHGQLVPTAIKIGSKYHVRKFGRWTNEQRDWVHHALVAYQSGVTSNLNTIISF